MLRSAARQFAPLVRQHAPLRQWTPSHVPSLSSTRFISQTSRRFTEAPTPSTSTNPSNTPPVDTSLEEPKRGVYSPPRLDVKPDSSWGGVFEGIHLAKQISNSTAAQKWTKNSESSQISLMSQKTGDAFSGRTVRVGHDVGEAFRRLDAILGRNKVRLTWRQQERHEKKGVKRRRLSSERWRKQFANEVRKKVQLVNQIRHRGA
ncbi:hypothetical protein HGRIS_013086 [Hohenbuehelia grisea]|uniref:Ribosomal protein S21 n=1 Tax=Hohenbuehelia grisea TaxID=104357 RepID=A0ABR3IUB9_9AGAR